MRIVPPIRPVRSGKILDTNLINHMIQRTEYGAELLARYKMVAGTNMFVEQAVYTHDFNGTSKATENKFYGELGCNGTVSLKFSTPMYLWLLEHM